MAGETGSNFLQGLSNMLELTVCPDNCISRIYNSPFGLVSCLASFSLSLSFCLILPDDHD